MEIGVILKMDLYSDKMQITHYGTGSCLDHNRAQSSFSIKYKNTNILFDCGEGTHHQIKRAGDNINSIDAIFISHNHGDHIGGIPTLLIGLDKQPRDELKIFGPRDCTFIYDWYFSDHPLHYKLNFTQLRQGDIKRIKDLSIEAFDANHGIPALMYKISNKTNNIFYTGDTAATDFYAIYAKDTDLLIHDCGGPKDHSTASEAGITAKLANAKKLALVHRSRKYKDEDIIEEVRRKKYSGEIILPKDLMLYSTQS